MFQLPMMAVTTVAAIPNIWQVQVFSDDGTGTGLSSYIMLKAPYNGQLVDVVHRIAGSTPTGNITVSLNGTPLAGLNPLSVSTNGTFTLAGNGAAFSAGDALTLSFGTPGGTVTGLDLVFEGTWSF